MPTVTWTKHVKSSKVSVVDATSLVYPWSQHLRKSLDPMCAGYVAATVGILVGHPLDSMKVLLQTRSSGVDTVVSSAPTKLPTTASLSVSRNLPNVTNISSVSNMGRVSDRKRSIRALYAGVSGPLLTTGIVASMNFAIYDTFRRILDHNDHDGVGTGSGRNYLYHDSILNVAISGAGSGAIVSFAISPLKVVKTKQQLMLWSMKKAVKATVAHQGGFRNFYSGFGVHFLCETIGRGVYYTSYEYFKRVVIRRNTIIADAGQTDSNKNFDTDPVTMISLKERMQCAAITGIVTWSIVFPLDVIRSKIYARATSLPKTVACPSSSQIVLEVWMKGGFKQFLKPFALALARAGPVHAIVLPIYDLTFDWLRSR